MNKLLLALACASAVPAHAEIVSFDYTAVISTLRQGPAADQLEGRAVVSTNLFPGALRVGDSVHGRLSYDTSTPQFSSSATSVTYAWGYNTQSTLLSDNSGQGWSVGGWSALSVTNGQYSDSFTISNQQPGPWNSISFLFSDPKGTAWSTLNIPVALDPADFYQAEVHSSWTIGSENIKVGGFITSMTRVSPVPEPATWALLAAGLAMVGGSVRSRTAPRSH